MCVIFLIKWRPHLRLVNLVVSQIDGGLTSYFLGTGLIFCIKICKNVKHPYIHGFAWSVSETLQNRIICWLKCDKQNK